ncbi:hypothetical protein LguiA_015118 [Lonicera macranthoides]
MSCAALLLAGYLELDLRTGDGIENVVMVEEEEEEEVVMDTVVVAVMQLAALVTHLASAISDLKSLSADMHKFESHYIRNLVGSEAALYERLPINFVEKFSCPIILFQGLEDRCEAVAYGAAVQGGILSGEGGDETKGVLLLDVATFTLDPMAALLFSLFSFSSKFNHPLQMSPKSHPKIDPINFNFTP